MSAQSQFAQKVQSLISQSKALSLDARQKVLELLDEARKKIIAQLAGMNPDSFSAAQLTVLKSSIDGAMEQFRSAATTVLDKYESSGFTLGSQTVSQPLASFGLESFGSVSSSALSIVQGYTADLITGLSKNAAAQINGALQRAFLGGQNITDIIKQVGAGLENGKEFSGLFSPIGKRATSITLNEIGRINSIASQARMEDAVQRHPDLKKQWHHLAIAMAPRPAHIAADQQVVPVDQPFIVGGEALMYPRDPNGSAENTINCHCIQAPYLDEATLKPTDEQKGLLESLGISVSAA